MTDVGLSNTKNEFCVWFPGLWTLHYAFSSLEVELLVQKSQERE